MMKDDIHGVMEAEDDHVCFFCNSRFSPQQCTALDFAVEGPSGKIYTAHYHFCGSCIPPELDEDQRFERACILRREFVDACIDDRTPVLPGMNQ